MRAADLARFVDALGALTVAEAQAVHLDKLHGRSLRDVVTHAVQSDLTQRGIPTSLQEWNARQIALGALVGFVYQCDTLDTLPTVARVFACLVPRQYVAAS